MNKQEASGYPVSAAPETQAIKYLGSKLKLLPSILRLSKKAAGDSDAAVFDGFSGSTRVSQAFAKAGYTVYANDTAPYTEIFNTAFLLNTEEPKKYQPLIDHLNALKPLDGWFTEQYGGDGAYKDSAAGDGLKKPWQKKNTRRLDAVRTEIDRLNLDAVTRAVAITSLILALDRVDSAVGHYASYLKEWSPRSYNDMKLEVPALWINRKKNVVMNRDIFDAVKHLPNERIVAYFDPPYGSNNEKMPASRVRYASYYHIWTTICLNDKPAVFGKAKRRADSADPLAGSVFEEFRRGRSGNYIVTEALERLMKETPARYIILSYSSGGRVAARELRNALQRHGNIIETEKIPYKKNVMAIMKWTDDWVKEGEEAHNEYVFLVETGQPQPPQPPAVLNGFPMPRL
ncbi:MAG: DNA adenine methylase [Spirochaetaceae bacterium]|jgi:adenine-specific DNA-methyltransferase|nr:DNA adenine methylase [Spirochaetaceae bacterium]